MAMMDAEQGLPRFKRARMALERFAPLAWIKSVSETNHITGLVQLPLLGWRFTEPHPELRDVFLSLARDVPQNIEWTFREDRNSLILPATIADSEEGSEGSGARMRGDQDICIAASEDMERIIDAIAAQPALPTVARMVVFQIAKSSPDELVCVAQEFTGEAEVGMNFRLVGMPDVELCLTALHRYPPRPETRRHGPLAKITLAGAGAGAIARKDLLVGVPPSQEHG
ncbi:hypothetical protein [Streptomyces xanthophaeus]